MEIVEDGFLMIIFAINNIFINSLARQQMSVFNFTINPVLNLKIGQRMINSGINNRMVKINVQGMNRFASKDSQINNGKLKK
ncbi:MAG: hypothetical protein WCJ54_06500 [Actinomycetota bacterium]